MKKTIITSIGFLFLTTNAFALDPFGPPVATPKKNNIAITNLEYLYGDMNLHSGSLTLITRPEPPALPESFIFSSADIKDIKMNKFYTNLISELGDDKFDFFLRLGIADANPNTSANRDNLAGSIADSDYGIALGGGIRTTLYQSDDGKAKFGLLAQLSYADIDFDEETFTINGSDFSLSATVKMLEIQIAAGPSYQITDKFSIYGGPFLHFVKADGNIKGRINGEFADGSCDIKQQSELGGFIGLSTDLSKNSKFNVEFQLTEDAQAIAFRFGYRF